MKILSLGLDNSALDKNSPLAKRLVSYGGLVGLYTVIVPSKESSQRVLSERVTVYGISSANKIFSFYRIFKKAKELISKHKYTIITVQDQYYLALLGYWLASKFKLGLEVQNHGWEKCAGLRKLIAKFVLPRAHAVRTVSQRLKKQLAGEFGVREERIMVVPVHVEVPELLGTESLNSRQVQDRKLIFLTVGRLVPVKNISLQIKAMARVVKNNPNIELWIAGEGKKKEDFKTEIKNFGMEENVKLLGWSGHKWLYNIYSQADVFLLTSLAEGWPITIIEAAFWGLPIIMTDVGSAGELIINKKTGLVIPVNDLDALVAAMEELINKPELREQLGKNASQAVLNLPTKQEILNLYRKSWEKAAAKSK